MTKVVIEDNKQINALNIWFYVFGAVTVILIAFFQAVTVYALTSFCLMMWIKQVGLQYKVGLNLDQTQFEIETQSEIIETLSTRMDLIDPYIKDRAEKDN